MAGLYEGQVLFKYLCRTRDGHRYNRTSAFLRNLQTAQKSGCPVIPVAITGTAEIFEQHLPFVKPSHVCIRYGEPIYIKELPAEKRKFPGAYTRDVIEGMLKEMKEEQEQDK